LQILLDNLQLHLNTHSCVHLTLARINNFYGFFQACQVSLRAWMSIVNLARGKDLANCDQDQNSHQHCLIPAESPIVPPSATRLLKSTDPLCELWAIVHSKRNIASL
jgi:hypothetical protein